MLPFLASTIGIDGGMIQQLDDGFSSPTAHDCNQMRLFEVPQSAKRGRPTNAKLCMEWRNRQANLTSSPHTRV